MTEIYKLKYLIGVQKNQLILPGKSMLEYLQTSKGTYCK